MKSKLLRRILAYMFDMILLIMLVGIVSLIFQSDIENMIKSTNYNYVTGVIDFNTYMDKISALFQSQDKQRIIFYIINIIYIVGYFIVLPLYNNGSTIGQKITGIKVEASYNQKLTFKSLFIRNLVLNGLLYLVFVILFLYLLPPKPYFILISCVGFIQITLVIISIFMVLYRKDKRGIHDLLAKTKVVTIK